MHANLIGGAWTDGVRTYQNTNPSDTRDVIGDYAVASREQALDAVAAAQAAFPAWSLSTPQQRFDVLDAVGITSPIKHWGPYITGGGGLEYHTDNPRFALGLGGDFGLFPDFDFMQAVSVHVYLRYTR